MHVHLCPCSCLRVFGFRCRSALSAQERARKLHSCLCCPFGVEAKERGEVGGVACFQPLLRRAAHACKSFVRKVQGQGLCPAHRVLMPCPRMLPFFWPSAISAVTYRDFAVGVSLHGMRCPARKCNPAGCCMVAVSHVPWFSQAIIPTSGCFMS